MRAMRERTDDAATRPCASSHALTCTHSTTVVCACACSARLRSGGVHDLHATVTGKPCLRWAIHAPRARTLSTRRVRCRRKSDKDAAWVQPRWMRVNSARCASWPAVAEHGRGWAVCAGWREVPGKVRVCSPPFWVLWWCRWAAWELRTAPLGRRAMCSWQQCVCVCVCDARAAGVSGERGVARAAAAPVWVQAE